VNRVRWVSNFYTYQWTQSVPTQVTGRSVGPLMNAALGRKFGAANIVSQGVAYPADWNGAMSGAVNPKAAEGAREMASMATKVLKECPESNVVLSGYSQGAEQVHGALMNLEGLGSKIAVSSVSPISVQD
jgi:cutinase